MASRDWQEGSELLFGCYHLDAAGAGAGLLIPRARLPGLVGGL